MRHNKIIKLPVVTITEDEYGNEVEEYTWEKVYANEYSVSSSEFYNAAVNGLRPEKEFEIYSAEYDGQDKFMFEGQQYSIIRTQGQGEKIRLIGEKVTADG